MSKFIKSVAAAAVLATSATGTHAASLSTDVDVSLPSVIALYCYDSVTVNVDADGLTAALGGTLDGTAGLGSATIDSFVADLEADSNGGIVAPDTSVDLQLNNVCAFRALVANGVEVTVAEAADPTLVNGTTPAAVIDASGISLSSDATVTTGLGLAAAPTPISVTVPLDLTDATAPGSYSKAELFTVTVTAL